jgi:hypothetical protein
MNLTGYLILIAALLIVASLLLYARFVSRSRRISSDQEESVSQPIESERDILEEFVEVEEKIPAAKEGTPSEAASIEVEGPISDEPFAMTAADAVAVAEELEVEKKVAEVEEPPTRVAMLHHDHRAASVESLEKDEDLERKGEYLDELQEAAAGLAMLMRSSPVSEARDPVVFAPDAEGDESSNAPIPTGEESTEEPVIEEPVIEEPAAEVETEEEAISEVAVSAGEVSTEPADEKHSRILALLGDEVSEQFTRIDSGLNDLEDLVNRIESSLAELTLPDQEEEEVPVEKAA